MGFTLQPMTSQIAPVTSDALTKFYKAKSVGIIYDSSQNYTKSTSEAVKSKLQKAGVKVTNYQAITRQVHLRIRVAAGGSEES